MARSQFGMFENIDFRAQFADWATNRFTYHHPNSRDEMERIMSRYTDFATVRSISSDPKFVYYVHVIKNQSPNDINVYIKSMRFKADWSFDLEETSKALFEIFDGSSGIRNILAPTIWTNELENLQPFFSKMRQQSWTDRLIGAKLLAAAILCQERIPIDGVARSLEAVGECSVFYYLRLLEYTNSREFLKILNARPFPLVEGSILEPTDRDDLGCFQWIVADFDPIEDVNLRRILANALTHTDDKFPIESLKNRMKFQEYRNAKAVYMDSNDPTDWFAKIFDKNEIYNFFNSNGREFIRVGRPSLSASINVLGVSLAYGRGNPLPLLEKLDTKQLINLFFTSPNYLCYSSISWRRVDVLEYLSSRSGIPWTLGTMLDSFVNGLEEKQIRAFVEHREEFLRTIKWFAKVDYRLWRDAAVHYISLADNYYYPSEEDKIYELLDRLEIGVESLPPDSVLRARLTARLQRGCDHGRTRRGVPRICMDSKSRRPRKQDFSEVADRIEKVAGKVGLGYTLFAVGKHLANGNIGGLGWDTANLWIMPKLGEAVGEKMLEANSALLRGAAPVVGRVVGNVFAFWGLYESIRERHRTPDVRIANLHIATNGIYILADVPAMVTGVMAQMGYEVGAIGAYAGPVGLAISVSVLIAADFIESGFRVDDLSKEISLTDREKHDAYWRFFLARGVIEYLKWDIEAKKDYEIYVGEVLSSIGEEYGKVVMSLPNILITREAYVTKSTDNALLGLWLEGFNHCKGEEKILQRQFDFDILTDFDDSKGIGGTSRLIPTDTKGFHLTIGPRENDISTRVVKSILKPVPASELCYLSKLNKYMRIRETNRSMHIPRNAVEYRRSHNASGITFFHIPTTDARIHLTKNDPIDLHFRGVDLQLIDHGSPSPNLTENRFHLSNERLTHCRIHKHGRNYFYVKGNSLDCDLTIGENVALVKNDFTDTRNLETIYGSEREEVLTISHAKYVNGGGGNDTIIGNNYTIVESHWGDSILGQTITLLPLKFEEIGNIVVGNASTIFYDNLNRSITIDKRSMITSLDSYVLTPIKTRFVHLHKISLDEVNLNEELNLLRGIENSNLMTCKQSTSSNYDIVIGDTGNNVYYAATDKTRMNFYWEGGKSTSHVYIFDRIQGNVTISRANGLLDFQLLENSYHRIRINRTEDSTIFEIGRLRVDLLNNYQNITLAMDGKYYKLNGTELIRDYCTHSLKIKGRMKVDATDLIHYNCFDFEDELPLFFKHRNDSILASVESILWIVNYNPSLDLSIRSQEKILIPDEFHARFKNPSALKLYKIGNEPVEIFHNQPVNKKDIGCVDLSNRSVSEVNAEIRGEDLHLGDLVVIRNWVSYPGARQLMFVFKDRGILNDKCLTSGRCEAKDILKEFRIHGREKREIDSNCVNNIALVYFLVQHFLDEKYPLPKLDNDVENLCERAFDVVEEFERVCGNDVECFESYQNVMEAMRNGNRSRFSILDSNKVEKTILDTLKNFVNRLYQ